MIYFERPLATLLSDGYGPGEAGGAKTHSPSGERVAAISEPVVVVHGNPHPLFSDRGHRAPGVIFEYLWGAPPTHHAPRGHPQAEPAPPLLQPRHVDAQRVRPDVRSLLRQLGQRIGTSGGFERFDYRQVQPQPRPKHGLR